MNRLWIIDSHLSADSTDEATDEFGKLLLVRDNVLQVMIGGHSGINEQVLLNRAKLILELDEVKI